MDHPNISTVDLLQQLKTSVTDSDEVARILLLILDSFEKEKDPDLLPTIITVVFGLPAKISLEDIDQVILQPFLPLVNQHLIKILSSILTVLDLDVSQDSLVSELTKSIEVCVQILSDVERLLSYLISLNQISVSQIFHLPKFVAEIVNQVFIHCQRSKKEYKEAFPAMRCQLMNLFQKCHKLQLSLFTLLNEKLVFNCTFEEEIQLLIDVLDILGSMANVVADLDTMSLVAHWKGYAQLTQTYATQLRPRLEVAGPINYLSVNTRHQLCSLNSFVHEDKKVVLRSLKISSLQLKVLIKLCEHYKGYLGDCHKELLNCVITLVAHTGQHLRQQGLAEDIVAQVTAHVSAGAAPLLTHLITDPCFVEEYFQLGDKLHSGPQTFQLGYCYLTNLIIKKITQLSSKDQDVQNLWLKPTVPLVNTVFLIMQQCSTSGEMSLVQEGDLYQAILQHTAAFIVATCTIVMFPHLEKILMRHLLQSCLWPALFSSDLICLIGRLGTSKLCFQLTCLLHEVLSCWAPCDRQRPEWVYVSWTLSRLVSLLSPDHLQDFSARFPSLSSLASDITTLLIAPVTDQTVSLFQTVVERLLFLGENTRGELSTPKQMLADPLYQLWQCMTVPPEVTSTESSHWFLGFYSVLVIATCKCINSFKNCQIGYMLDVLLKVCSHKTSLFHCGACELLRCLSTKSFDNDSNQTLVCQRISSLFVQLLQDTNPITKQVILESFLYFAYLTKYEQVVATTVASNAQLQAEITDYFQGIPAGSSEQSVPDYLKCFELHFVHRCKLNINHHKLEVEDTKPNPCKKLKTGVPEEELCAAIQRIQSDLYSIEEYSYSNVLSVSNTTSLRNIYNRIDKVIKASETR